MTSYRFRRRAFMTALSGGVGLKILLRNLEGSAQGMRSPARLLVTHWPVGIVAGSNDALWKPTSGSVGGSPALKPFADAGLGTDMTVLRGLTTGALATSPGGASEQGLVTLVTGLQSLGNRTGEQENDDAIAAGPSFDQLLLKNVPALQRPGQGFANSIADSRTDFGEIASKCLSYSNDRQNVTLIDQSVVQEAKPLLGEISPVVQFNNLFSSFVPGTGGSGGTAGAGGSAPQPVANAVLKKLVGRRSVLDFSLEELNKLKAMAPADARNKLSIHADAVQAAEAQLTAAINAAYPNPGGSGGTGGASGSGGAGGSGGASSCGDGACKKLVAPPSPTAGMANPSKGVGGNYADPRAKQDDSTIHAQAGAAHLAVLKAAFICDLIRVGTFQWSPATNHVSFPLYPGDTTPYQHHPASHKISTSDTQAAATLSGLNTYAQFLFNVHSWYFARMAETFADWKKSVDGCGNSLLDFTCVPFLTEIRACGHERSNIPAMLIGGKRLGFQHDRYVTAPITINELWGTIAQAYGYASTTAPLAAPVPGFWIQPA